jgi:DNA-binding beta-propeller fold protein YncE
MLRLVFHPPPFHFMLTRSFFLCSLLLAAPVWADKIVQVAAEVPLKEPFGTGFDAEANLWIVEMVAGNRLFKVSRDGVVTHVAGKLEPGYSGDGGPALEAQFNGPHNLVVLPNGNVLIGDTWNGVVREVDVKTGVVKTVPGWKAPAGKERGNGPYCITLAPDGKTLHIANLSQVFALDLQTGTSRVIAGNGSKGVPEDGAVAVEAPLVDPRAVAADSAGNVYILERNGNALRVVDLDGKIRTVVNKSGEKGLYGDGGNALEAKMSGPKHLCVDQDDTVLIADAENHVIRRYLPKTGVIKRVAGHGKKAADGLGGDPLAGGLARPHGVTIHPQSGELYITDSYNDRILKIEKGQ